jgi:ubiquitin-protein ligase
MASGIGYGNESYTKFDMKKFLSDKKIKTRDIIKNLELIKSQLEINCDKITIDLVQSKLSTILYYYLFDVNILEITNKLKEYELVIEILEKIKDIGFENIQTGSDDLEKLVKQLGTTIDDYIKLSDSDKDICSLGLRVADLYKKNQVDQILSQEELYVLANNFSTYDDLKPLQFESANIKNFCPKLQKIESLSLDSQKRIMRELSSLKKSLPFNYETSVFFRYDDVSMNKIKFLITGPKDTPYQDGCFIFDMILPLDYPNNCPQVQIVTTGKGSVRFNPNLYSCGKVCLSLLGTWSSRPEEGWNENSTMLQLFVSIQSLIFIDHPYFNEPGYQSSYGTSQGMARSAQYNADVQANNIKWAIIDSIINPEPCFADVITTHFRLKKDNILAMATEWAKTNTRVQSQLDTLKSALAKF